MLNLLGKKLDTRPHLKTKQTRTHCMVACQYKDPYLVIYPEGIWFHCPDGSTMDRIVSEHLEQNREISELIFHRLGLEDTYVEKTTDV